MVYVTNTSISLHYETRMVRSYETFEAAAKRAQEGTPRPESSHVGNVNNYVHDEGLFEKVELFYFLWDF